MFAFHGVTALISSMGAHWLVVWVNEAGTGLLSAFPDERLTCEQRLLRLCSVKAEVAAPLRFHFAGHGKKKVTEIWRIHMEPVESQRRHFRLITGPRQMCNIRKQSRSWSNEKQKRDWNSSFLQLARTTTATPLPCFLSPRNTFCVWQKIDFYP